MKNEAPGRAPGTLSTDGEIRRSINVSVRKRFGSVSRIHLRAGPADLLRRRINNLIGEFLKIRELVKHSGVSKETIHYYLREGLLPRPRKQGKNVAEYDHSFVERIRLIKELQDRYFFPLSVIKNILVKQKKSPEWRSFLNLRREYFRPVDQFLPNEIAGEEAFRNETGLGKRWLAKMEEWKIISPEVRNGLKVYSQDDITLGKLIVRMDHIGLGPKDGFDPEALKHYLDRFQEITILSQKYYIGTALGKLSPEEFSKRIAEGREIMSLFFYHLYHKLSRERYRSILALLESEAKDSEEEDLDPGNTSVEG